MPSARISNNFKYYPSKLVLNYLFRQIQHPGILNNKIELQRSQHNLYTEL